MAHQCTACGRTFEDGSTAMLSGCPECGGNTFQYFKGDPPDTTGTPPEPDVEAGVSGAVGETVGKARAAVSGLVGEGPESTRSAGARDDDDDIVVAEESPVPPTGSGTGDRAPGGEGPPTRSPDTRRDAPEPEPRTPTGPPTDGATGSEAAAEPSLEELRAELNDQFESIKILEPGQYELNLMELYEREEHIIALQEDGRYVIDVPGTGDFGTD